MKQCCRDYLMEQFGDEDVIGEIYEEYVNSVHEKLPEIEAALATENWSAVDAQAHALKGNALAVGDTEVADTAIALRSAAKMSETDNGRALLEKLKELAKTI